MPERAPRTPGTPWRLAVALALGVAAAAYVYASAAHVGHTVRDFDQLWYGGRALRDGLSPYGAVGPGRTFDTTFVLYYPLPAVLLALPLTWLPLAIARALFAGLGAATLGFVATRDGFARLWMCASGAFVMAVWSAQWSPLLTAALFATGLGVVCAAKPNVGLAVLVADPTPTAIAAAALVTVASLLVQPTWVAEWLANVAAAPHLRAPLTHPFGALVLLAASRWRRPEARLLLVMAAVPQNAAVYEVLPLFAIPRGRREHMLLAALSLVVLMEQMGVLFDYDRRVPIVLCYLPALLMVLGRPNEGRVPAWVERLAARLARGWGRVPGPVAGGGSSESV